MSRNGHGGGAMDLLKKKRQSMSVARAQQDIERKTKQEDEDRKFKEARQGGFRAVDEEHETKLRMQSISGQSAIDLMRRVHSEELAGIQRRQAHNLAMLEAENAKKLTGIKSDAATKRDKLRRDSQREDEYRLEVRKRDDGDLKRKRDAEDDELKVAIFKIFDAGVLESCGSTQKDANSPKKQQRARTTQSALEKEVAALKPRPEFSQRQKLHQEPEVEALNDAPPSDAARDTDLAFEIVSTCVDCAWQPSHMWNVNEHLLNPNKQVRTLHHNTSLNTFDVYAGKENLTLKYPDYAYCVDGKSDIYFDKEIKRLATGSHRAGWLRLEFYDGELEAFLELCETHFPNAKLLGDHEIARERWGKPRGAGKLKD